MNRNLENVIEDTIKEIPESECNLICSLKSKQESVSLSAPELMYIWWQEVHDCLMYDIGEKPTEEWQYKVLSIFSTKTIEELKVIFGDSKI
jgi:hypothetical protein